MKLYTTVLESSYQHQSVQPSVYMEWGTIGKSKRLKVAIIYKQTSGMGVELSVLSEDTKEQLTVK